MTFLARCHGMQAYQREARHVVFETNRLAPARLVMTAAALAAGLAGMDIIGAMAVRACPVSLLLVHDTAVTGITAQVFVTAPQGKLRLSVVIELRLFPIARRMTGVAVLAETAIVVIITTVAGDAPGIYLPAEIAAAMTGIARHLPVPAGQRVVCFRVMVESYLFPFAFPMTVITDLPVFSAMDVVEAVAGITFLRRILVLSPRVTAVTVRFAVAATQREVTQVMIEFLPCPRTLPVAVRALLAQVAIMHIVLAVAFDTGRRRLAELAVHGMA